VSDADTDEVAAAPRAAANAAPTSAVKERQPPGLFLLFGVEMWERFSYYGMRALLILYLVDGQNGLGWDKPRAARLYGWYNSLVYLTPVMGGYLADRFIGTHRAMVIGGAIIAAGHFSMAVPSHTSFFLGLLLIIIGTGFFKANVSTMVGQLYREGDPRRDGGFTIFYMGINAGALVGPIVCGYLGESPRWGWHYGFGAAGIGMVLGLLMYLRLKARYLPGIGLATNREAAVAARHESGGRLSRDERQRVLALFVIFFFVIFFWMAFEQAGSSMNLFASERVDRVAFGFHFPASWFQSVNPAVILIFAPIFAALWTSLGRKGREPSTPAKMAAAMVMMGLGFLVMVAGAARSDGGGRVSPLWLIGVYGLHTWAELCLSPIGLSAVTRLAPLKYASVFMGLWFLATSISELLAGQLAAVTDRIGRGELYHLFGGQADFYFIFVVTSAAAAVGLMVLTPWLRRRMHEHDV
jgi:POT family proton-dependent oligopeptide transporter